MRIGAALAALALLLGGCAMAPGTLPDGVSVAVYQPRTEIASGRLAIQVRNGGDAPLEVMAATFHSPAFRDPLAWEAGRTVEIAPGTAVDLRIPAGVADCDADRFAGSVVLEFASDGQRGSASLEPEDEFGIVRQLHDTGCLAERAAAVARLSTTGIEGGGTGTPGELVVSIEPSGEGALELVAVRSTTLLAPAVDGTGMPSVELGVTVGRDGPHELRIPIVPNRCDPHALAEDKVGTRIPVEIRGDGFEGRIVLEATDDARATMRAFFATYCGL